MWGWVGWEIDVSGGDEGNEPHCLAVVDEFLKNNK